MPANKNINLKRGFTVIELIIVMGMMVTLTGMVTISLLTSQRLATLSATIITLESDLKQQQLKAMDGDNSNGAYASSDHGIHFESDKYTLFRDDYISGIGDTFIVNLESNISLTTTGDLIFAKGSGESSGMTAITLKDSFNNQKTLTINSKGVVINESN